LDFSVVNSRQQTSSLHPVGKAATPSFDVPKRGALIMRWPGWAGFECCRWFQ